MLMQIIEANPLRTWLIALLAAGLAGLALLGARQVVLRQLRRLATHTSTQVGRVLAEVLAATRGWFLVILSLWVGTRFLVIPAELRTALGVAAALLFLLQLALWGQTGIQGYAKRYSERRLAEDAASVTTIRALSLLGVFGLWVVIFLMALATVGIDVTALVAGLGIGGIAVALAVQNILGDLFASLSIVLDKPFVYGDFIIVDDDYLGTVENIGLKTTRVRSLSGEQLVFANSDLLKSRVRNYKRMQQRRVVFEFGVERDTPRSALARIPEIVRTAVEDQPDTRFDRSHFRDFGQFAYNFETVYYVLSSDYNVYMDRQQAINLEILRRFEADGIEFAYPTRTLLLTGAPVLSAAEGSA